MDKIINEGIKKLTCASVFLQFGAQPNVESQNVPSILGENNTTITGMLAFSSIWLLDAMITQILQWEMLFVQSK